MILRVSSSGFCLALATAGLSGVLVCSPRAGGQERGRPIEFSRPKSTEVSTNLHQLGTKRDCLRQLQDDLLQPFGAFGPKSSLDGVLAPASAVPTPAAPPILSKRAKELQERRKNLIFMSPEDLVPGLSPEEIFKMPQYDKNGQERKKLSPLEQYYERLDHSGDAAATQNPRKEGQTFDARKSPDQRKNSESQDDALTHQPGGLKEGEQTLKGIVETELSSGAFGPSLTPVSASDIFGFSKNTATPEETEKQKAYKTELYKLYGVPLPPDSGAGASSVNTIGSIIDSPSHSINAASSLDGVPNWGLRNGFDAQSGALNRGFTSGGLPDASRKLPGLAGPETSLPKVEPQKLMPLAPTFAAPVRPFP